jgi:Cu/Zn superoxide dismutase
MSMLRLCTLGAVVLFATVSGISSAAPLTTLKIEMRALNNSGENGTATLTQMPGGVRVTVSLTNAPNSAQPTHIHVGTCGNINKAPEYALVNTTDGKGTSVVAGVKLADLLKGHYAINVHKSASALGTYVSCGNIMAPKG